jgi:hypothetical protein
MLKRQWYAWLLLMLLVAGSIGIPVYRHTCLQEKITISTVFIPSDHCKIQHKQGEQKTFSCCEKTATQATSSFDSNCCEEEASMLKLPLTYFEDGHSPIHWVVKIIPSPFTDLPYQMPAVQSHVELPAIPDPPPPLRTFERLPILCVWRL